MTKHLKVPVTQEDHHKGNLNSPVVIVEYGDYECVHTARAHQWMGQLLKEFGDEVALVYRHFPLTDIHPHSAFAAVAAETAAKKGRFWEMHQLLIENYRTLSGENIIVLAGQLGLNVDSFIHDMDQDDLMDEICRDIVSGEESEVETTPSFFINSVMVEGVISYASLKEHITHHLNGAALR